MHQTQFSEKIPYGGFSQIRSHFSATSHGKGACDCLGETVKRLAARASLQRPYKYQIMTTAYVPAAYFGYCSKDDYEREQQHLEQQFHLPWESVVILHLIK